MIKEAYLIDENGHEYQNHGTIEFPIAFYNTENVGFPLHFHDEMELIYVYDGTLELQIKNQSYLIHENEAILINSNVIHGLNSGIYKEKDTVFNPKLLSGDHNVMYTKYIYPFINSNIDCIIFNKDNNLINDIQQLFSIYQNKDALFEFKLRDILTKLFIYSYTTFEDQINVTRNDSQYYVVRKTLLYIKENYQKDIGLDDIVNLVNLSKREIQRLFRQYLGVSPYQCILNERLSNACLLLINTGQSVSEVCFNCGFKDVSSFIKQFKEHYNMTPKQYRLNSIQ